MPLKAELVIIDPQNDFCDPAGSLFVPGADADCTRIAALIDRVGDRLNDIHVTLDSHHLLDIAHPNFWVDSEGNNPDPYQLILQADVENGTWKPFNPAFNELVLNYVTALAVTDRYKLVIWPPHCLIGSWGTQVQPEVWAALNRWEAKNRAHTDYVTKGSNYKTEHYSAVQADVPDPKDNGTQLNTKFIDTLQNADIVGIAGEALDYCVANTFRDVADNFGEENIQKLVLLEDLTSSVNAPNCEHFGPDFMAEMIGRGMKVQKSTDFLA
jgi:nicotinamidase-related amidase